MNTAAPVTRVTRTAIVPMLPKDGGEARRWHKMKVEIVFRPAPDRYFSVTGELTECRKDGTVLKGGGWTGGAIHDEIVAVFPDLADVVRWHLCDEDAIPMHYVANAFFWLKSGDPEAWEHFCTTVVLGACPGDEKVSRGNVPSPVFSWLEGRRAALKSAMTADLAKIGMTIP